MGGRPVVVERDGGPQRDEAAVRGAVSDETEHGPVERIDARRGDPETPESEREDRVVGVARVVVRGPVRLDDGQVRLAAESLVKRREHAARGFTVLPRVLEPARADLGVGAAVDATLVSVLASQLAIIAQAA